MFKKLLNKMLSSFTKKGSNNKKLKPIITEPNTALHKFLDLPKNEVKNNNLKTIKNATSNIKKYDTDINDDVITQTLYHQQILQVNDTNSVDNTSKGGGGYINHVTSNYESSSSSSNHGGSHSSHDYSHTSSYSETSSSYTDSSSSY